MTERHSGQTFSLPPLSHMTQHISHVDQMNKTSPNADVRDSGNWSLPSKHSSTVSSNPGLHLQTILNPDNSPSNRFSTTSSNTPSSARYPSDASGLQGLPHLNQSYQHRDSIDSTGNGTFLESRRSSVDSNRVSMNMGQLQLNNNPTSPYESANTSRVSLASSLQQQRGIHTPRLNGFRPSSPNGSRQGVKPAAPIRIAPPIIGPRGGGAPDPTASTPTKGYAWAFPDTLEEEDDSPSSSRQGSVNTLESNSYGGSHHMHALQPKSVTSLQGMDAASIGSGNYSRTPELRISHKLAERKRRSEMKDLFEQLNQILPNSPGSKSSKWEVLTKAIDYISSIQGTTSRAQRELDQYREELMASRTALDEARAYEAELAAMYQQLCRLDPKGAHVYGPKTHALARQQEDQASTGHPHVSTNGRSQQQQQSQQQDPLPPPPSQAGPPQAANTSPWGQASSNAMQGIEYANSYDRR